MIDWLHESPTRLQMLSNGWRLDTTKSPDSTSCFYCTAEHSNWQPNDNPLAVHQQLSPCCPFLLSSSSAPKSTILKNRAPIFFDTRREANQFDPNIIQRSSSIYSDLRKRRDSFPNHLRTQFIDIEAVVKSGFYYNASARIIQCFHCESSITNIQNIAPSHINARHYRIAPHCAYVSALDHETETGVTGNFHLFHNKRIYQCH